MTLAYFRQQIEKLVSVFGENEYPTARVKDIWSYVHDLPDESFRKIIKHFCDTKPVKYPPLPIEFITEAQTQRKYLNMKTTLKVVEDIKSGEFGGPEKLKEVLDRFGASSLQDAVQKNKKAKE